MWLKSKLVSASAVFIFLVGCMSAPIEHYAKSGDYLHIPLGSILLNAQSRYIKPSDITLTIVDSAGTTFPVKVVKTFRLFADPASTNNERAINGGWDALTSRYDDGVWIAQVRLVNPTTNQPLALTAGPAHFVVVAQKLLRDGQPPSGNAFPMNNLPVEILPGVNSSPFSGVYAILQNQNNFLTNVKQIEVVPQGLDAALAPFEGDGVVLAGAQFVFTCKPADFADVCPRVERIIPDKYVQMLVNYSEPDAANVVTVKVVVMNSSGFYPNAEADIKVNDLTASLYDALTVVMVWNSGVVTDANWQNSIQLVESESYYFDKHGNKLTGITTAMQKVN